jgi:hypothetical protein
MRANTLKLSLTYDQLIGLIRQLPASEKIKLGREIAREALDTKLSKLLQLFKTDDLTEDAITKEVEQVRAELYAKKKGN